MRGLVILNWRQSQGDCQMQRVDLVQRADLLDAVMKTPGLPHAGRGRHWQPLHGPGRPQHARQH